MPTDLLNRANFGLLPKPEGRFGSFTVSVVANVVAAVLLILFTIAQLHQPHPVPRYEAPQLVFVAPPPKPVLPPVPKIKVVAPPVEQPKVELPRKIEIPKPQPEPPKPQTVKLNNPEMPKIPPAPPKAVTPPPQPKVGLFASPHPTAVANNNNAPSVKTGGFGDPVGVKPNANATGPTRLASAGSFNMAPGEAQGAGAARRGAVQGTAFGSGVANGVPGGTSRGSVASAGFSNGTVGGTPGGTGTGRGNVASAGFSNNLNGAPPPVSHVQAKPGASGLVVTYEPKPQYTSEARQLRIEGEVTLEVRFGANGRVEVLRVVNGLGHGLDEQAKVAAQQMRFKPAERDGQPVDQVTMVHIVFQLA